MKSAARRRPVAAPAAASLARSPAERSPVRPARGSADAPASAWLLDRTRDLGLTVAAPLWIVPLLYVAGALATDRAVNDWVMALGSVGHHLPGMLRAYGDRSLFRRFRVRFLVAPLALGALCIGFASAGLHALVLVAFAWGVWHGLMQTFGFARIYGAKAGAASPARVDFALLATWFTAGVVFSPLRLHFLLDVAATCGLPLPPPVAIAFGKLALAVATASATIVWLAFAARARSAGRPVGIVRVVLLVTSIAFWWFANVRVRHPLLGMPLFELFHDVQYLAIVWAFNRRRVAGAGDGELAPALRALFRPTLGAALVYVGLVAAYGALGFAGPGGGLGPVATGLLAASQLLHFYYDGFIWKVREPSTSAALGVRPATTPPNRVGPTALRHAFRWGWLVAPCLLLAVAEARRSMPVRERAASLAALVPDNPLAQFSAAELQWERGDSDGALAGFRRALALDPELAPARENLAVSLGRLADAATTAGDHARARQLLDELRALRPRLGGDVALMADQLLARDP